MGIVTISLFTSMLPRGIDTGPGEPVVLNRIFKNALDLMEHSTEHIFISGRAGTGKSTLLRLFMRTTKKNAVVIAPTGVAALNVGGQTIHSFFRFPTGIIQNSQLKKHRGRKIFQNLEILIIDEVSMVRADLLDNIDYSLRMNRESPLPFGGVRMIFIGDMYQIPPVIAKEFEHKYILSNYSSPYFFSSNALSNNNIHIEFIELNEVFRQIDRSFVALLESIRTNQMDWELLEELNSRYNPENSEDGHYITLCSVNATANRINMEKLEELDSPMFLFDSAVEGDFPSAMFPTDPVLALKTGAQVMFIRNDPEKQYVNGTIGIISYLDSSVIKVMVSESGSEKEIEVYPEIWENNRYVLEDKNPEKIRQETIGTFNQYPLKLAWAITIHKSQGKTFDMVKIDMGRGAFTHGMTYVALSRCRTLEGIVLNTPIRPNDIKVDNTIVEYMESLRR